MTVIACGLMVANALEAAESLADEGISVRVVDMFCIKPIDKDLVLKCAEETGAIVSAEEHNVIGGLGSAISEVLARNCSIVPMSFAGINDCHAECGPYRLLQKKYCIDAEGIAEKVREVLSKKK